MKVNIQYIAFDLGGVLVELNDFPQLFTGSSEQQVQEHFWTQWLHSPTVRAFDCGKISFNEFVTAFLTEYKLNISEQEFRRAYLQWPKGLFPGVDSLLTELAKDFHLMILSNNNEVHWNIMLNRWGINRYMYKAYSSHLIGAVKPDKEIFEFVIADLNVKPRNILFLDDNLMNVEAARQAGLRAEISNGIQGAKEILQTYNLLPK